MSPPDLSIIIVNWNGRELLRQCLASLDAASADLHVEILVVDNASSDGSADMVPAEYPHVRLLENTENLGFARANNQAAAVSRGRFLFFLNNDTVVRPDSLRNLLEFLEQHPEVGMIGPRLIGADGNPQRSYRGRPTVAALLHRLTLLKWTGLFRRPYERYRREVFDADALRTVDTVLGAAVCLPRDVFFSHGGWDERFPFGLEDFDLSARVARTHQVLFFPGAEIVHFGKMSSRRNLGFAFTGVECGYARYLRKHALGPMSVGLYKLLVTLNLPLAVAAEAVRELWRRWRRGPAPADRPHSELVPLWHFATRGLPLFWRS
jgi:GT2 family glycosyltransferase